MPDIAMCHGEDCPKKDACYRHTATPFKYLQTWMEAVRKPNGSCEHFWADKRVSIGALKKDMLI